MGEYADMAIDFMLAADEYALDHIDDPDVDEDLLWSPFGRMMGRTRRRQLKVCNLCKTPGLRWGLDEENNWVLENRDGTRHVCKFKNRFKKNV